MITAAIDLGYGSVKLVSPSGSVAMFPSLVRNAAEIDITGIDLLSSRSNIYRLDIGGETLVAGPGLEHLAGGDTRTVSESYCDSPQHQALYLAALRMMALRTIDVLAVGVPVLTPASRVDALKERLTGAHRLSEKHVCTVNKVVVLSQGVGAYAHHLHTLALSGELTSLEALPTVLVVDVGHCTTDWVVMRGYSVDAAQSGSVAYGGAACLHAVARHVSEVTGSRPPDVWDLERALRHNQRLKVNGQPLEWTVHLEAATRVAEKGLRAIMAVVARTSSLDAVVLAGGAHRFYADSIARAFPAHEIIKIADAAFANVRGYASIISRAAANGRV